MNGSEPADKSKLPGKEPREVFSGAVALAKELLQSKSLALRVDRDGDVQLDLQTDAIAELPDEKFPPPLTRSLFHVLVRTELSSLLTACTYSDAARAIKNEIPEEVVQEVGMEELQWRLEEIRCDLGPLNLGERVKLRKTTKGPVLEEITWEIGVKKDDEVEGKLGDVPFVNLCIKYADPAAAQPRLRFFGDKGSLTISAPVQVERVTFQLHEADIQEVIETLSDVRDRLVQMRTGQ